MRLSSIAVAVLACVGIISASARAATFRDARWDRMALSEGGADAVALAAWPPGLDGSAHEPTSYVLAALPTSLMEMVEAAGPDVALSTRYTAAASGEPAKLQPDLEAALCAASPGQQQATLTLTQRSAFSTPWGGRVDPNDEDAAPSSADASSSSSDAVEGEAVPADSPQTIAVATAPSARSTQAIVFIVILSGAAAVTAVALTSHWLWLRSRARQTPGPIVLPHPDQLLQMTPAEIQRVRQLPQMRRAA
jgi:hypothetical protein